MYAICLMTTIHFKNNINNYNICVNYINNHYTDTRKLAHMLWKELIQFYL